MEGEEKILNELDITIMYWSLAKVNDQMKEFSWRVKTVAFVEFCIDHIWNQIHTKKTETPAKGLNVKSIHLSLFGCLVLESAITIWAREKRKITFC